VVVAAVVTTTLLLVEQVVQVAVRQVKQESPHALHRPLVQLTLVVAVVVEFLVT
jgi:hypothetical protein